MNITGKKLKLAGQRFGRLVVLKDSGKRKNHGRVVWDCLCDCGNLKEVRGEGLKSGGTRSCGCLRKENGKDRRIHPAKVRLNRRMSRNLYKILKGDKKGTPWIELVGYNDQELQTYLEARFAPEMGWDNYGTYWVVDHIVPKQLFDHRNRMELLMCWALPNLQPMVRYENEVIKRARLDYYSKEFMENKLEEIRQFVSERL